MYLLFVIIETRNWEIIPALYSVLLWHLFRHFSDIHTADELILKGRGDPISFAKFQLQEALGNQREFSSPKLSTPKVIFGKSS